MPGSDRIEKKVLLRASRARVWRAVTDAGEFGSWFRAKLESGFAVGKRVSGRVTYPGYENLKFEVTVERMDAEQLFSFRWHPFAVDPGVDYSKEPTTLVVFELEEVPDGTRLTITETGFDGIPLARRAQAFKMNDQGWAAQARLVEKYVAGAAGR